MQKQNHCKYCGNLTTCKDMCGSCRYRYDLVHTLKLMKPPKSTKKMSEKIIILEKGDLRKKEVFG